MGDPSKSSNAENDKPSRQKSASVKDFCKTYKSLLQKWHTDGYPPSPKDQDKFTISSPTLLVRTTSYLNPIPCSPMKLSENSTKQTSTNPLSINDGEELHISSPTLLARITSRISCGGQIPHVSTDSSQKDNSPLSGRTDHSFGTNFPESLSMGNPPKVASPMTTPIFFSQSGARLKPPPVVKKLECSLEELCFGCVKKINITRDALSSNGLIIREEEVLTIKVQPGWPRETKIIFEGKGDERPGTLAADIIFEIEERKHPLYSRRGDDLELGLKVPLMDALTGCTLSIPLLGGEDTELTIEEEVIYPGYETTIPEQGMPRPRHREQGTGTTRRGDLRLTFIVHFPTHFTKEQRSQVATVLEECSYM